MQSKTIAVFFLPTAFVAAKRMAAFANIGYSLPLSLRSSISQTKPINCPSVDRGSVSSGASLPPILGIGTSLSSGRSGVWRCLFKFCRLFVSGRTAGGILHPPTATLAPLDADADRPKRILAPSRGRADAAEEALKVDSFFKTHRGLKFA